jgi:aryl-alcohol dehydrogenase-like predicted oxidoreductase
MTNLPVSPLDLQQKSLGLGCWVFGADQWHGQARAELMVAMAAALEQGITHFDTASGYGNGLSEEVVGQFLIGKREQVFLASKAALDQMDARQMLDRVNQSLVRLQTEMIDLYYIHWPRSGKDMRPLMEGLELARQQGKIRAIGVSNFSVEQMAQIAEVGKIDACQLGYNLFWRGGERKVIPNCREQGIAMITYSSIAQGILTGKFPRDLHLQPGDQRSGIVLFDPEVWPYIHEGVEQLKTLAQDINRPLAHLAIRWVLHQAGITSALAGARTAQQVVQNVQAMAGDIPPALFERMTEISNQVIPHIPDVGNMCRYYP